MKISFAIKLGVLLIFLLSGLATGVLWYFYSYSKSVMMDDLRQRITDVIHTGSFIIDESARQDLLSLRRTLYQNLPDSIEQDVLSFAQRQPKGQFKEFLSENTSNQLQQRSEFTYLVQLLRRVQAGSQMHVDGLGNKAQSDMFIDCDMSPSQLIAQNTERSSVRWSYLLVPVPGVPTAEALMFLADSNYQGPENTIANPIGNVYLPRAVFSQPFSTGKIAVSDWYKDEFDPCVSVMTASVPIKDDNGKTIAVLAADYPVTQFEQRMAGLIKAGSHIAVVTFSIALILTFVIAYWIAVPLGKLRTGATQLSKKDFAHRIQINSNDEFGLVADTMNQVSQNMQSFTDNMEALVSKRTEALTEANEKVAQLNRTLTKENASLGAEVDNIIQVRSKPFEDIKQMSNITGFAINAHYIASKALCGDFVVVHQGSDTTFVHLGHISGYGLKTASLALQLQAMLQHSHPNSLEGVQLLISDFVAFINQDVALPYAVTLSSVVIKEGTIVYSDAPTKSNAVLLYSNGFRRAVNQLYTVSEDHMTPSEFLQSVDYPNRGIDEICDELRERVWSPDWEDDISCVSIEWR